MQKQRKTDLHRTFMSLPAYQIPQKRSSRETVPTMVRSIVLYVSVSPWYNWRGH